MVDHHNVLHQKSIHHVLHTASETHSACINTLMHNSTALYVATKNAGQSFCCWHACAVPDKKCRQGKRVLCPP